MKCIVFLVAAAACISLVQSDPPKVPDIYKKAFDECNADPATSVADDIKEKAKRHEKINYNPQLGAFIFCVSKKVGSMNENGDIVVDKVRDGLKRIIKDDAEVNASVQKCTEQKATPEETAFHLWSCSTKVLKDHIPPKP